MQTTLFLDGGDAVETAAIDNKLKAAGLSGIGGQTTNPTLITKKLVSGVEDLVSRNSNQDPRHQTQDPRPKTLTSDQAFTEYRRIVTEMAKVTKGPISIQVIGSPEMKADEMLTQARDRITWIPNGVIKFPCTIEGLIAASTFCQEGPVNITLVFSQAQAAAVYTATKYHQYDVFVSPFVGRLDDRGENGMDVIANILDMYHRFGDGHVKVLTASVRNLLHMQYAMKLGSDCMTVPGKIITEWIEKGNSEPTADFLYHVPGLTDIPYQELSLDADWQSYNLKHDLTSSGVAKFWSDWQSIVTC